MAGTVWKAIMPPDDAQVESLLLEWYTHFQNGHEVSVADVCRARPDLIDRVAARVAPVRRVEQARANICARPADLLAPPSDPVSALLAADDLAKLTQLARFRIIRLLGVGGMGAVFLAEDPRARRPIALKVMRPERSQIADARERFLREARAAAALAHDNLMPVFEVGEGGDSGEGLYIVMPYFDGETLAARLARGPLPTAELLRAGRHIALGLVAAHAKTILHRDLKPSNVWLEHLSDPDAGPWRARVMDFGLSLDQREAVRLTMSGVHVGTPGYMSPEQVLGGKLDGRSDLFGLGVVLHEAAAGVPLFGQRSNLLDVLKAIESEPAPAAPLRAAGLPSRLIDLILMLLEKDPAARPRSAHEVAAECRAIAQECAPAR